MTYVVTFVLLLLGPLAWRKGWHWTGFLVVVLGVLYALTAQPWMQELLKGQASAWLTPQQGRWDARLGELERAVQELGQRVQGQGAAVEAGAGRFESQQASLTAEQEARRVLEETLSATREQVERHETQLAGLSTAAQDLAAGEATESFSSRDAARRILLPAGKGRSVAYLQLAHVPRPETLRVRWASTALAKGDYALYKNILIVRAKKDAGKLAKQPLSVSYVPDSSKSGERATMALQDGAVTADGQRVEDLITF
ncbi:MAG: hypothetical protein HYT90_05250 [Candidatus Omnitrophica bacterium]|nr:hypothetical protein [Candidatus Omnitrophota bacterium]